LKTHISAPSTQITSKKSTFNFLSLGRTKKIVFIISGIHRALAFEWIHQALKTKFLVCYILLGESNTPLAQFLKQNDATILEVNCNAWWNPIAFVKVLWSLIMNRPYLVHTHLINANMIGLSVAWLLRIKKRIYTRHHALVHHREHKKGLWIDKWCNFASTHVVAISKNVFDILIDLERVPPEKIRLVHHGFDLNYLRNPDFKKVESLKQKGATTTAYPVIGVISRYQQWKGVQYIIPAFVRLLDQYPQAKLILANASGNFKKEIKTLLISVPASAFIEIEFEDNTAELYRMFDVFVHVPIDEQSEAFGQTYVESLACGVPSVFTLSGVAREFVEHEKNALVVPFCDSDAIHLAIERILTDKVLRQNLIANGEKSAAQFPLKKMIYNLEKLYTT
jgi:glycosyltransferase involved in cell wall biosynthesis